MTKHIKQNEIAQIFLKLSSQMFKWVVCEGLGRSMDLGSYHTMLIFNKCIIHFDNYFSSKVYHDYASITSTKIMLDFHNACLNKPYILHTHIEK